MRRGYIYIYKYVCAYLVYIIVVRYEHFVCLGDGIGHVFFFSLSALFAQNLFLLEQWWGVGGLCSFEAFPCSGSGSFAREKPSFLQILTFLLL